MKTTKDLRPSYWTIGRKGGDSSDSQDVLRDWQAIVKSGLIKPTGINLDWLKRLSPLGDCVFLNYGKPYDLLPPFPDRSPVVEFNTDQLLRSGAMTSRDLDGGLWWDLDDEAREAARQAAAGTVFALDPEELFFTLQESYVDKTHFAYPELRKRFERAFQSRVDARFRKEALKGDAARRFLLGLDEDEIEEFGLELYFPGPLLLSMAKRTTIPKVFHG